MTGDRIYHGWSSSDAGAFSEEWLPSWTGGNADRLLQFFSDDAFYSAPAIRAGIIGSTALRRYFERLLAAFPEWRWTHERSLPLPAGFLNYWTARLTGAPDARTWMGVCVVQLQGRLITRNEVFFDRSPVIDHLRAAAR